MTSSLQLLFEQIDRLKNERDLRSQVLPKVSEHFATTRAGIFFFDELCTFNPNLQKILKVALSIRQRRCYANEHNPIARYLDHYAPIHEELVTSPKAWKMICPRPDHWHVMTGPIVSRGRLWIDR
jgi:hypothetical protein